MHIQTIFCSIATVLVLSSCGAPSPSSSGGTGPAADGNGQGGAGGSAGAMALGGSTNQTGGREGQGGSPGSPNSGGSGTAGATEWGFGGGEGLTGGKSGAGDGLGAGGRAMAGSGGKGGLGGASNAGGDVAPTGAGGSKASGGTGGSSSAAGGAAGTGGAASNCVAPQSPGSNGMNPGQACLSCHKNRPANQRWTVAGNLYDSASGAKALSGATITITDANKTVITLVTGSDGAFFTTKSVAFPVTVSASKCPDTQTMPTSPDNGDCNNCHTAGSRIHLP